VARCARLHSRPNTRNRLSYLAAWVFLAAAASAAQQPCAVRGVVTDQSTGKPVAGARLFLMPHAQGQHASLLQRSNEQGAFCFGAVDRGNYTLRTQRAGFLDHTPTPSWRRWP
jgi:hypothetical protein